MKLPNLDTFAAMATIVAAAPVVISGIWWISRKLRKENAVGEGTITFYLDENKDLDSKKIGVFLNRIALLASEGKTIKWNASYSKKSRISNDIRSSKIYDATRDSELKQADETERYFQRFVDFFSSRSATSSLQFGEGQSLDSLYKNVLIDLLYFIKRGMSKQPDSSKIALDIVSPDNPYLAYVVYVDKSEADRLFSAYNIDTDTVFKHNISANILALDTFSLSDTVRMQLYKAVAEKFILSGRPETVEELQTICSRLGDFQIGPH